MTTTMITERRAVIGPRMDQSDPELPPGVCSTGYGGLGFSAVVAG